MKSWNGRSIWIKQEGHAIEKEARTGLAPNENVKIGGRQAAAKKLWDEMTAEDKKQYKDLAKKWNAEGTPEEVMMTCVLTAAAVFQSTYCD